MTVAELGVRMSSAEFSDWQRFAEVEPFGPLAAGAAAAAFLSYHRDEKKRPHHVTATEALKIYADDPPTPEELRKAQVNAGIAALMGLSAGKPRTVRQRPRG